MILADQMSLRAEMDVASRRDGCVIKMTIVVKQTTPKTHFKVLNQYLPSLGDNSDEKSCQPTTCDPIKEFQCSESNCISARWRCDGESDCPKNSSDKNAVGLDEQVSFPLFFSDNSRIVFRLLTSKTSLSS